MVLNRATHHICVFQFLTVLVYLVWEFVKHFSFLLFPFSCLSPLRFLYMLETLVHDEQKFHVVRRFTALTQLEGLLAKYISVEWVKIWAGAFSRFLGTGICVN